MNYDVVVVGDGPAGSYAAAHACAGHDVALVGEGPRRMQCAGLISASGLDRIGVKPGGWVLNKLRGSKIISPSGVEVVVDGRGVKAYAVDRIAFDNHLIDAAVDCGVEYVNGWVNSIDGGVILRGGKKLDAAKTVLATGTDYTLQRQIGYDVPKEFLIGGQYEMRCECEQDFVELYFNVPDFFSWIIPVGDRVRIGLCTKSNPRPHLDSFVKNLKKEGRIKSDKVFSESFGIIPLHNPSMKTQFGDVLTLGDAAGHVKASTGGGIVMGCVAAEHVLKPDYERLWRSDIGFELRLHLMIYRFLASLSDDSKDRFFTSLREAQDSLSRAGDMDLASKTVLSMLTNPRFMGKMILNMPWLVKDIIF